MFSLCLCGFPRGILVSSHSPKTIRVAHCRKWGVVGINWMFAVNEHKCLVKPPCIKVVLNLDILEPAAQADLAHVSCCCNQVICKYELYPPKEGRVFRQQPDRHNNAGLCAMG